MDPLWLSLSAIVVVIVGVLVVRLHPFQGTLLRSASCCSTHSWRAIGGGRAERRGVIHCFDRWGKLRRVGPDGCWSNLVYRRAEGGRYLQEVGAIQLVPDDDDASHGTIEAGGFSVVKGDLLLHVSRKALVAKAAKVSAGQRLAVGFGDTAERSEFSIAMASVIGMCLLESGAARRIVDLNT